MNRRLRLGAIAILLVLPGTALAHRLDEIPPGDAPFARADRLVLKIDLTPGVQVAPALVARITTDRDGRISEEEGRAYANQVLNDVVLEADGRKQQLQLVRMTFPRSKRWARAWARFGSRRGPRGRLVPGRTGSFSKQPSAATEACTWSTRSFPASPEIEITSQDRDPLQREIRVAFKR